jgi:hypothetical protein
MRESRVEEYRRKARECRSQAGETTEYATKTGWLKLADKWQRLAEEAYPAPAGRAAAGEGADLRGAAG